MGRIACAAAILIALLVAPAAQAAGPRYDVPSGYTRCAHATGWHGFFKWASTRNTSCRQAATFMRAYAAAADAGPMPRALRGYRCTIHYWRDEDGNIYASRHVCERGDAVIRFYGMV